jgi:hypothetical protein
MVYLVSKFPIYASNYSDINVLIGLINREAAWCTVVSGDA